MNAVYSKDESPTIWKYDEVKYFKGLGQHSSSLPSQFRHIDLETFQDEMVTVWHVGDEKECQSFIDEKNQNKNVVVDTEETITLSKSYVLALEDRVKALEDKLEVFVKQNMKILTNIESRPGQMTQFGLEIKYVYTDSMLTDALGSGLDGEEFLNLAKKVFGSEHFSNGITWSKLNKTFQSDVNTLLSMFSMFSFYYLFHFNNISFFRCNNQSSSGNEKS